MPVRSGRSTKSSSARNTGPPGSQPKTVLTRRQPGSGSTTGKPRIPQVSGLAGPFGCSAHGRPPDCARWLRKTCDYSMEMVGMVAKRAQIEELPQFFSGKRTKGVVGMHVLLWLVHSHLASRQTPLGPWSLIRAVGLPQMRTGHSFDGRGCSLCTTTPSRLLLVPLSVLSRPNVARHMRIRHDIISGSFLLDDKHA